MRGREDGNEYMKGKKGKKSEYARYCKGKVMSEGEKDCSGDVSEGK